MEAKNYRDEAVEWWRSLSDSQKAAYFQKYMGHSAQYYNFPTGFQMEYIYKREKKIS